MDSPPHSPDALPQAPSVKAWPDLPELKKYYPPEAERKHIEGTVVMQVTLDAEGRATDTLILFEDPPDQGFGAAASSLAHVMEFNNPTGGTAQLKYKVKFALPHKPAAPSGAGTGAAAGSTAAGVGNTGTGTTNFEQPNNNQTP
jgi:TonB family protein